jgi:uncharacterized membrane protein/S-adenosylmethionine/arginine decarboxylase-like enzyme
MHLAAARTHATVGFADESVDATAAIRPWTERVLQSILYEAGGLLLVTPAYAVATGHHTSEALPVLIAVSIATMLWAAIHNTLFDIVEWNLTHRVASDRPHAWRMLHAVSTEATSILVTTPVIMLVGGFGLWEALLIDIGLTLAYSVYAYFYHMGFDVMRPMRRASAPHMAFMQETPAKPVARRFGMHIIIDGFDAPADLLDDGVRLYQLLQELPARLGMSQLMPPELYWTSPMSQQDRSGFTGFAMGAAGHVNIRTMPAHRYVALDVYMDEPRQNPDQLVGLLKRAFTLADVDVTVRGRGLPDRALRNSRLAPI